MQTALLNTYPPQFIVTILKVLREQLNENDRLIAVAEIAGPAPEIHLEYDQILKEGGFWDDVNGRYLSGEDLVLTARREEVEWVHSEGVSEIVPIQECEDAGKKQWELIWMDTDKSVDPVHKKIRSRLCQGIQDEEARRVQRALLASQFFSVTT